LASEDKYVRFEFSRLATLRNVAVAAVIALGCVAIVFAVAYFSRTGLQTPPAAPPQPSPSAGAVLPGTSTGSATRKLIPPTPEILAQLPPDTSPVVYEVPSNLKGEAREAYKRQLHDQAVDRRGPWEQYNSSGVRVFQEDAQGNLTEPCPSIQVEKDKSWQHMVVFTPDGQHRYHAYSFRYACGHSAGVSPDPHRDLMFADPAAVAKEYALKLCRDCESMRQYQDAKPGASGGGTK